VEEGLEVSTDVFVANSHTWLYERLVEYATLDEGITHLVGSRRSADVIIYLDPPWPDPDAPDRLRSFRPRELLHTYVFSQSDLPIPWAPGMYASLASSRAGAGFTGGFYVAHHHREPDGLFDDLEAARDIETDLLWSFVGTLSNDPLRQRLREIQDPYGLVQDTQHFSDTVRWGWQATHRAEGRRAFSEYGAMLGRSSFILCPRGVGASSIRLFEALQVGRCPVVISDEWLPPPFVDWNLCSIRVPESRVLDLPEILREREPEAKALGREARLVWECYFSPQHQLRTLVQACLAFESTSPRRLANLGAALLDAETARRAYRAARRWIIRPRESRKARDPQ
jgi:Exostosin family